MSVLLLDIESGGIQPLGYEIAYKIYCNYTKQVVMVRSFYVKQFDTLPHLVANFQTPLKMGLIREQIEQGDTESLSLTDILKTLRQDLKRYNVKEIASYNLNFDYQCLLRTIALLNFDSYSVWVKRLGKLRKMCLMHNIVISLCNTEHYRNFCLEHNYISSKGYARYSLSIVLKYLVGNHYELEHTALYDITYLDKIYAMLKRKDFSIEYGLKSNCYNRLIPLVEEVENNCIISVDN